MKILFMLIAAHALCDFSLQSDLMANAKNRFKEHLIHAHVPWFYWLGSHALIHGGAVAFIVGSPLLGLGEALIHFKTDDDKCAGRIGIHEDQAIHIACKLVWWALWGVFL